MITSKMADHQPEFIALPTLPKPEFNCEKSTLELHRCKNCKFTTQFFIILNKHKKHAHFPKTQTPEIHFQRRVCNLCKFDTHSSLPWLKHSLVECQRHLKWFKCDHCQFKTLDENAFKEHKHKPRKKETPKNEEIAKISKNEKTANFSKNEGTDKTVTTKRVEWFKCEQCPFKTTIKGSLRRHTKHAVPEDDKWFQCDQCPFKTLNKYYIGTHINLNHVSRENLEFFPCPHCDYKTPQKCSLGRHILYKHNDSKDAFKFNCDQCDYKCKAKTQMRKHKISRHTPAEAIQWFQCEQCEYKAKIKNLLKQHVTAKHTPDEDIKWLHCPYCEYKAKLKKNLIAHVDLRHVDLIQK